MAAAGTASSAASFAADFAAATVVLVGLLASERCRAEAPVAAAGVATASEERFLFAVPAPLLFENLKRGNFSLFRVF